MTVDKFVIRKYLPQELECALSPLVFWISSHLFLFPFLAICNTIYNNIFMTKLTTAFRLAYGHFELEIEILDHCTLYSTVSKVHKSPTT